MKLNAFLAKRNQANVNRFIESEVSVNNDVKLPQKKLSGSFVIEEYKVITFVGDGEPNEQQMAELNQLVNTGNKNRTQSQYQR